MSVLGIDLGGTKVSGAVFTNEGVMLQKDLLMLDNKQGSAVGRLVQNLIRGLLYGAGGKEITSVGVCVPGIARLATETVWAPNIAGWDNYPLLAELKELCCPVPVSIDSDRACYILGEHWKGNAQGCKDAIYLSVGTGIGAGILVNGSVLRGAHDIAGAIGWMALDRPFKDKYNSCGCFEHHASGEGIAKICREILQQTTEYNGILSKLTVNSITATDVFAAYEEGDGVARQVMQQCIEFWGMAIANLTSLFNPEKIIFGGGVFGPGLQFIDEIKQEADRWAQPISAGQVSLEASALGSDAGIYGAAFLALKNINEV